LLSLLDAYRLRRTALAAVALVGFLSAIAATTAAIEGHPDAGVVIDPAGRVESVSPTGFAWRDGIRPEQVVLRSSPSDSETGWGLVVSGPSGPLASHEAPVLEALRGSLPFALAGLAAGCLGIAFLRLNRGWALPSASLALVGSSLPLFLANQPATVAVLGLSAAVPAAGLAVRIRRRRALAATFAIASTVLVAAWAWAFLHGTAGDALEPARRVLALGGTGVLMADRAMQNRPTRVKPWPALWIAAAAALVIGGLALVYFAVFPAPFIGIAIVLGLLLVPPLRGMLGHRLELALMSDLRQQVAADVAEEERGRLARELHDAPLQELSAVIRSLELVPEAHAQAASLQAIADELRSVAVDLRPPMLDDIGLGAALDFLTEQVSTPGTPVEIELEDHTGPERERRPPPAVEFALYRIVREAVANSLRHADAQRVRISGQLSPEAIDLTVVDDGVGISAEAGKRASGRGRLGLASMRRRAQAIGAELTLEAARAPSAGTRMSVRWRA
jgi:signal transduction histidine kinase